MSTFTGDVNKLVEAPVLQNFLIDKDATPMSGGTVTMYHDNSRTTLKNWYYQSGTPGNYTYITLPNPLTLSAAGTICDINGVDTLPLYYPWSELDENIKDPYFVTIVNHAMTNQITRANFPFGGVSGGNERVAIDTFNNLIINNEFWRNLAPNTLNVTPYTTITYNASNNMLVPAAGPAYATIVAPSQHDGFRMPDIQFVKNNLTGTDTVTFTPFPLSNTQVIPGPPAFITPEYYVNHICSGPGSGETQKSYQFPISLHVNSLANVPFTFSIQARNDPLGSTAPGAATISIFILQDTGTGGGPPFASPIPFFQITLNSSWTNYSISSVFPATSGLVLGAGADDALYLQVQMPLNVACNIDFTKPSIYLTENNIIPNNDFETYDQIDTVINSPRTGDIRTSINSFYYFGWLPMNDGTIGNKASAASSNATARANADTWQLFNLLWNVAAPYSASGAGTTNPLAQMYTSTGTPVGYGPNITAPTTAYSDFTANNQLSLSKMMGRVMLGTVPLSALLPAQPTIVGWKSVVTASSSSGVLFTSATANSLFLFTGNTVTFTSTAALINVAANVVYYVISIPGSFTQFRIATTFGNAMAGTAIGYTGAEGGTVTAYLQQTISTEGEFAHTQLLAELATHNHTYQTLTNDLSPSSGSTGPVTFVGSTTGFAGNSTPFNVTQPGTFYNMFIKL